MLKEYGSSKAIEDKPPFCILSVMGGRRGKRSVFWKVNWIFKNTLMNSLNINFLYALGTIPFGYWAICVLGPSSETHMVLGSTHKVAHTLQQIEIKYVYANRLIMNYASYVWVHSSSNNLLLGPHILPNNVHDSTLLSSSLLSYTNILKQFGLLIMLTQD